jgi:hypothetical protein
MAAGWSAANKAAGKIMTIMQLRILKNEDFIIADIPSSGTTVDNANPKGREMQTTTQLKVTTRSRSSY